MLELRQVNIKFTEPVIEDGSLLIPDGELTALTGPSGSGKTTLLYCVGLVSSCKDYEYVFDGKQVDLSSEEEKGNGFADGMQMIYKQLMTELENLGVKPIEAVGQEFNPDYHNAVMQVESEEYESGIVAQELQKGYMYRESVVRHSMVAVVQ